MSDIEHETQNRSFLKRKVVLAGITRNEMIQAADEAVAQYENDGRLVVQTDGPAGECTLNRHDSPIRVYQQRKACVK